MGIEVKKEKEIAESVLRRALERTRWKGRLKRKEREREREREREGGGGEKELLLY